MMPNAPRVAWLVLLLCATMQTFAQQRILIEAGLGRHHLSSFTRFEQGTNNPDLFWTGVGWFTSGGAELTYRPAERIAVGMNGFWDFSQLDSRTASENLSRAHVFIGTERLIANLSGKLTGHSLLAGAQFEVGRIGGAQRSIPEGTWSYGLGGHLTWQLSDYWGVVIRGTAYWHKEKQVVSVVYVHKYRLAGIRAGIRYSLNWKKTEQHP